MKRGLLYDHHCCNGSERRRRRFGQAEVGKIVEALITEIKIPFKLLGRIARKCEEARPVREKLSDVDDRKRLLVRAKNLKNEGFDKIFLVPDLTKIQQEEDKN